MNYEWTCNCCGKRFNSLPLDFAVTAPDPWFGLSEEEREARGKLDSDVCMIDRDIFVRGCLEIPIIRHADKFIYGVWVSVSQSSFRRILDLWQAPEIEDEPALFGWLCNNIQGYPTTFGLKTN